MPLPHTWGKGQGMGKYLVAPGLRVDRIPSCSQAPAWECMSSRLCPDIWRLCRFSLISTDAVRCAHHILRSMLAGRDAPTMIRESRSNPLSRKEGLFGLVPTPVVTTVFAAPGPSAEARRYPAYFESFLKGGMEGDFLATPRGALSLDIFP
jgi:hypothetical protein